MQNLISSDLFFALLALNLPFMTNERKLETRISYHYLYNFLLVLNEDQIFKLRNIAIGTKSLSAFSEHEIRELEVKLDERIIRE